MASRDLLIWENERRKRLPSGTATLDFGSIKIGASGIEIKQTGSDLDFSGVKLTNIASGSAATDAVSKGQMEAYVQQIAVSGGQVKESILITEQLSDTQGILAAEILYFTANPVAGDTIVLTNGTDTETYTADTDFTIGATAADTMGNLATAINGAGAGKWYAKFEVDALDGFNAGGVVVVYERTTAAGASTSRIYGVWGTQASASVIPFDGVTEYKKEVASITLPSSDPAAVKFGIRRQVSALKGGEIHLIHSTDSLKEWNDDASTWYTLSADAVPVATDTNNGSVKGKATFDYSKGLAVTNGTVEVRVDGSTITFGSGQLKVATGGITANELAATSVTAAKLGSDVAGNGLTGGNGSAISALADSTGGANLAKAINVSANGLAVKVDSDTIQENGSGQLQVKYTDVYTSGEGSATINAGDAVYIYNDSGTWKVKLASATVLNLNTYQYGIAAEEISAGLTGLVYNRRGAIVDGYSSLAGEYFIDRTTAGAKVNSLTGWVAGEHVVSLGKAVSSTQLEFDPEYVMEY